MIWMPLLIGAAAGALMNKKDPLKGAMMGAAMGYTGGAAAPGLLGGAAASGAAAGGAAATGAASSSIAPLAFNAAADSQLANVALGSEALAGYGGAVSPGIAVNGSPGLLSQFKDVASQAKPFGDAMSAAKQAQGLLGGQPDAPIQSAQMPQYAGGSQILGQLAQQGDQGQQMAMQADAERKKRRMSLLGGVA